MEASVHFEKDRHGDGTVESICGLRSHTLPITTLASQVTCRRCRDIDENPER